MVFCAFSKAGFDSKALPSKRRKKSKTKGLLRQSEKAVEANLTVILFMIPGGFGLSLIPGPETATSCTILETWPHTCVIEAGRLRRRRLRKDGRGTKRPNFQAQWAKGFFSSSSCCFLQNSVLRGGGGGGGKGHPGGGG